PVEPGEHARVAGGPAPELHAEVDRDDERQDAADQAGDGLTRVGRAPRLPAGERDYRDDEAHQPADQGEREQDEREARYQARHPDDERGDAEAVADSRRAGRDGLGGIRWLTCPHDWLPYCWPPRADKAIITPRPAAIQLVGRRAAPMPSSHRPGRSPIG